MTEVIFAVLAHEACLGAIGLSVGWQDACYSHVPVRRESIGDKSKQSVPLTWARDGAGQLQVSLQARYLDKHLRF
jgi:hypothetical protein